MRELPPGWALATVGDVTAKPQYGWTTKADPGGAGLKLLRTTDIAPGVIDWPTVPACSDDPPDPEKYLLAPGDIVVSRAGSVGLSIRIREAPPTVFASYLIRIKPQGVDPAYLNWFLKSPGYWAQIQEAAAGIALQNVNAKKLAGLRLPIPPLAEQRRIVAAIEEQLSRLEAAVSALTTAGGRVAQFRRGVLEAVFSSPAPQVRVGDLAKLTDGPFGSNLKTSHYVAAGPRVVRLQNIGDGFFRDEEAHITREHYATLVKHTVEPGDVVAASLGDHAPRACLIPGWLGPAVVKADCIRVRAGERILPGFLMWALNSPPVKQQAEARIKGIGRPRLGVGGLRELQVPVPALEAQRAQCDEIDRLFAAADAMELELCAAMARADALQRAVLATAFRGKLVPHDPNDEPASVLLERIAAQRAAERPRSERRKVGAV